ncbi:MAG: Fe2+-dependent dioxygenase [Planctomycetes bacterium]|nr:Fe2+-dependent dioxygenase [Planctomycetota bacterium]
MLLTIPAVLNPDELARARAILATAPWADGKATAGYQSAMVKRNQQLPEEAAETRELQKLVLQALGRNAMFASAALPLRVYPPLFNRYGEGMTFGDHIDNAIRRPPAGQGGPLRTDVSATLFISEPGDYEGGELVVEDSYGSHRVKLAAGAMVVYPASSIHRVEPVTRGARIACFFWVQSLVREDARRTLLFDLDGALGGLRKRGLAGEPEMIGLTGIYHNLLRMWSET